MRIDDLYEHPLSTKGQIRGLSHCVNDLSDIVLEQSVQIERLRGESDRSWSIINSQNENCSELNKKEARSRNERKAK